MRTSGLVRIAVRVAGRDHRAVDHHRDAVGDAEHRVHVVLDQQDRVRGLEAREQPQHALGLLGAHAGQRLVEQQHARPGRQAHRDLELALVAVAQRAGDALGHAVEAGRGQRLARRRRCSSAQWLADCQMAHGRGVAACAASRQFSSTVNSGKMVVRW